MSITKPIEITQEQYEKGFFAIDRKTADHYFINAAAGISLWVCRDLESLKNTNTAMRSGEMPSAEVNGVVIINDSGVEEEIEAITYDTQDSWNDLDLDELAEGRITWK